MSIYVHMLRSPFVHQLNWRLILCGTWYSNVPIAQYMCTWNASVLNTILRLKRIKKTNSEITLGPFFPRLRRINFLTTFVFVVVPFWFSTTFNSGWVLIFIARAQHRSNLRRLFVTTSSDSHLFLCPSLVHRSMPCSINYSVTPTHAERGKPEWLSDTKNWKKKKNRW